MRAQLCQGLIELSSNEEMIFLTGDLGFMALEGLQEKLQNRFINAGVAEQNMIGVAAGMASEGMIPWVYSIAPFCYARPFEQIRNDVAFHNLPVKLLGNGGGYGYGVMGPSHHAIEDYGVLQTLPNFKIYIPCFNEDIDSVLSLANSNSSPTYIRLGYDESSNKYKPPKYKPWRQLTSGGGPVVIVTGPIATTYIEDFQRLDKKIRPNMWLLSELPIRKGFLPKELIKQIKLQKNLYIIEEHVAQGGIASQISLLLMQINLRVDSFTNLYAKSHHFERYGSQKFLRQKSAIDLNSVLKMILKKKL
jgi:transketolase